MAQLTKWSSPHIRLTTLEEILGYPIDTFRQYKSGDFDEVIAIRVPKDKWKWYGIDEAMRQLGLENLSVIYINI